MDKHMINPLAAQSNAALEAASRSALTIPLLMADSIQSRTLIDQIFKISQCKCVLLPPASELEPSASLIGAEVIVVDLLALQAPYGYNEIVERIKAGDTKVVLLNVPKGLMDRMGRNVITLSPTCSIQEILNALGKWMPELKEGVKTPASQIKRRLTSSEMRVLKCLGYGMGNDEIAERLCISFHTVKTHLYHSYQKLGCRNRAEAALWAERYLHDD